MSLFPLGEQEFHRFGRVEDPYKIFEIEDVPDDNESSMSETEQPSYVGLAVSESKLRTIFTVLFTVLVVIAGRSAYLQLIKGQYYGALAEGNRIRIEPMASDRGIIYDRNGKKLALNVPNFEAAIRPGALPVDWAERQNFMVKMASILAIDPIVIEERLREYSPDRSSHVIVADDLTREQAILIDIEASGNPAVFLTSGTRREYPGTVQASSLSHLLGYIGKVTDQDLAEHDDYLISDTIGKTGLERTYESIMRGRYGRRRVEVDATGRLKKVVATDDGDPGHDLRLSIDLDLQRDVETMLKEGIDKVKAGRGAAVVMNPQSGELLAFVSMPAYDNNAFARGITATEYSKLMDDVNRPLFPRASSGLLPSGSTFKLIVAAAALAEGVISPSTSVVSTGGVRVGQWFFPDWKAGGHGVTNVIKAIAESVNTFFYVVGGGNDAFPHIRPLGISRIAEYAVKFGLGQRTGLDLPSEAEGFVPTPEWKEEQRNEMWYVGDTYHVAIGQGDILVTPLQVARYTAVFANGGYLVTPHLVGGVIGADGKEEATPVVSSEEPIISMSVVNTIRAGMRQAVTSGSARSLNVSDWKVAAKTGTAQWHPTKNSHAWFTSFAPFDKPEIVVTVVVEEGGEGSSVGAAVAKAIYHRYFTGELVGVYAPEAGAAPVESVRDFEITNDASGGAVEFPTAEAPQPSIPAKPEHPRNPVTNVIEWIFDSQ